MTTTRPGRHRAPRTPLRTRLADLLDLLGQHGGADGHAAWITQLSALPTYQPAERLPDGAPASADPSIPA